MVSFSQDKKERIESTNYFLKAYFHLPNVTTNAFYKNVSRGISDAGISLNRQITNKIHLGIGAKHSFFEISQFKIAENLDAQTHFIGAFGEIGYIHYFNEILLADFSMQVGYQEMISTSNPCRAMGIKSHTSSSMYVNPNVTLILRSGDRMGYSFSFGYTFTQSSFSPQTVCLDKFKDYTLEDYRGPIQHVNVGFGFIVYLGKMNLLQE